MRLVIALFSLLVALAGWFWSEPGNRFYVLDRAIAHEFTWAAPLLVLLGADVNGRDYSVDVTPWEPNHPVMTAVLHRDLKLLRSLLANGGEVNFLWAEGYSPLWIAVRNNDPACVRELVKAGADPDFPTWMLEATPRRLATDRGFSEVLIQFEQSPNTR